MPESISSISSEEPANILYNNTKVSALIERNPDDLPIDETPVGAQFKAITTLNLSDYESNPEGLIDSERANAYLAMQELARNGVSPEEARIRERYLFLGTAAGTFAEGADLMPYLPSPTIPEGGIDVPNPRYVYFMVGTMTSNPKARKIEDNYTSSGSNIIPSVSSIRS